MDFCENSLITLTTGQEVMEFIGVYVYSEVFTTLCRAIDFFFHYGQQTWKTHGLFFMLFRLAMIFNGDFYIAFGVFSFCLDPEIFVVFGAFTPVCVVLR